MTALAATGVVASPVLSACAEDSPTAGAAALGAASGVAASAVRRDAADSSALPDGVAVVQSFGADLYRALSAKPGNLVCSPYSVAVALAMTRNGARGQTATEMDAVLDAPTLERLNGGFNALQLHLDTRAGQQRRADGTTATIAFDGANSLWGQGSTAWQDGFLDALARSYGSGMRLVDYIADAEGAREEINAWTGEQTRGRIPELIPPRVLDSLTRLVLVNAIYLKAPWEEPFASADTQPATFTRADQSIVTTPMMRGRLRRAGYVAGQGWQAVNLLYAGSALAMAVVVPDAGGLTALESGLDGPALSELLSGFSPAEVVLDLPRWTFRTQAPLNEALAALGMPTAFDPHDADFSGMTEQEELYISAVLHEAFIAVDEEGTEAAAATAVVVSTTSAGPPPIVLSVDRPFLFVIHDIETATPLFVGRVEDPTA